MKDAQLKFLSPGAKREGERLGEGTKKYKPGSFWGFKRNVPTAFAQANRKDPTKPEEKFWQAVRNRQIFGYKFRRQHIIGQYIADFACEELKLVVEIDGAHHSEELDLNKNKFLESQGYQIVRYGNHEILQNLDLMILDFERRVQDSAIQLKNTPSPNLSPSHYVPGERDYIVQ